MMPITLLRIGRSINNFESMSEIRQVAQRKGALAFFSARHLGGCDLPSLRVNRLSYT
jgi:hypothetical protein